MPDIYTAEPTLKTTLLILRAYLLEYLQKWYWYVIVGGILVTYTYITTKQKDLTYTGAITFMSTSDSPARFSGIMQLAGQLGINSGSGGELKSEKILDLLSSKNITYSTLTKKIEVNGKSDMLFNHYLDLFDMRNQIAKNDTSLANFSFTNTNPAKFSFKENKVAAMIYRKIMDTQLATSISKSGIMRADCTSTSEPFSKEFPEELVKTLTDYYTTKSVEQEYQAYRVIDKRVDSLYRLLISKEHALAEWIDDHRTALRAGTLSASVMMQQQRLENEAEVLSVMYVEAAKNREIAKMNLVSGTPIIQVIDYPHFPLPFYKPGALIPCVLSLFAALVLVTVLLTLRKLIADAMKT